MTGTEALAAGDERIDLTHPDKVLYPADGYRKRDVAEYYRAVADRMVPHLRGRPLTMRRFPDGVGRPGFFQKEASVHFPDWVRVEPVPQRGAGGPVHHVVCDGAATVLYLATQACLECHVGLAAVDEPDRPLLLVVDLDPPPDADLAELRSVVREFRDRFADAGLAPHLQATGGKGFHVVAPLAGRRGFDEVRAAVRDMAQDAVRASPERLTTEQRKDARGDRIFLDVGRNAYGQTMIAPCSLRARDGAPAATPLDFAELSKATPRSYGLANLPRRLARKRDPWSDLAATAADFPRP